MNWNNDMGGYGKILSNIFQQMEQNSVNDRHVYMYDQNGQLQYIDPNSPIPAGTIDLTFQEITEDKLPES